MASQRQGFGRFIMAGVIAATSLNVWPAARGALRAGQVRYYSTAAPPAGLGGPSPVAWVGVEEPPREGDVFAGLPPLHEPLADPAVRPAATDEATATPTVRPGPAPPDPAALIVAAQAAIAACQERFADVRDYTCTFVKRERIDGDLSEPNVMVMKARSEPFSVYFRFVRPTQGREAIYIQGRNGGHAIVHDVGIGKLVAGTVKLDPKSRRAMDGNRHPITDAGIGHLIDTLERRWEKEMNPADTRVTIKPNMLVNKRPCTMIVSNHPIYNRKFQFHEVRVYIDHELGLPIRFEAYDWPRRPGSKPELLEEYTYQSLRINAKLSEMDFDPSNPSYGFGRF